MGRGDNHVSVHAFPYPLRARLREKYVLLGIARVYRHAVYLAEDGFARGGAVVARAIRAGHIAPDERHVSTVNL